MYINNKASNVQGSTATKHNTHTLRASPPPFHGNYFKSNRRRTGSDTSTTSSTSLSIVFVAARSSWVA